MTIAHTRAAMTNSPGTTTPGLTRRRPPARYLQARVFVFAVGFDPKKTPQLVFSLEMDFVSVVFRVLSHLHYTAYQAVGVNYLCWYTLV